MNELLNKKFQETVECEDEASRKRIAKIVRLFAKDEVTFFEAKNELNKVKELLQYCKIKSPEINQDNKE